MTIITINENSPLPLPTLSVGRASALNAELHNVDRSYSNVQIMLGQVSSGGATVACTCRLRPGGVWSLYASGAYFLVTGRAKYHITAKTAQGDSVYLGSGVLLITDSVLNVEETDLPVLPEEMYVRGSNGLYYRVTVNLDEDGVPYMNVDPEGITK